ncbi:hypothetical protein QVD99_008049 [Batrachochytrium dendrobatidis]|nr:hypothetical protein O5D80_004797 [Batrachochytrium dendrobatidis]KAK5665204.1 hypothetical protein QVD99_008049 [Batrachochytrium dendrobatidis]
MGKKDIHRYRRTLCGILFWTKCVLAALLGIASVGIMAYWVYDMYITAKLNEPVLGPMDLTPENCQHQPGLSRLEPAAGRILVGFHLDWKLETPSTIKAITGWAPAISNAFVMFDPTIPNPMDYNLLTWHVWQVSLVGGIFQLTVQPVNINQIPDSTLDTFAQALRDLNAKYGVPILLRYGHEMNGDWTDYGYQPTAFTQGFVKMAKKVRMYTNMTAMVWGPNLGVTYPFITSEADVVLPTAKSNPIDFALLDTNKDGKITSLDDPYGPYYPGDEWVDWVSMSLYWYPDGNTGYNILPPDNYFLDSLHGSGENIPKINPVIVNNGGLHDFYERFAHQKNKPFMIPETSAPYISSKPFIKKEADIKQNWWRQIFDAAKKLPLLKAVVFFEELKVDDETRDWRILANDTVRPVFLADQSANRHDYAYALDLKFTCSGQVKVK